jgi:hypothetical protein
VDTHPSPARKIPHPLWFLAGLIGLILTTLLWKQAFPTAQVSFTIKRDEILPLLQKRVEIFHPSLESTHSALTFSSDTETQYYLEQEVGQKKLEELQQSGLNIWYWQTRWFKPEQQEEWGAALDPQGRWVGYTHTIEENRPVESLGEAEAKALAETFLQQQITHHPLAKLRFVETQTESKPHRKDFTFTWEREDLRVKEAPYRLYVTIQGNQVGGYSENLKIPEAWSREFARKRELNELFQNIAEYACALLFLGVLVIVLIDIRNGRFQWSIPGTLPWIILMGLGSLLQTVNQIPSLLFSYSTTDPWSGFWSKEILDTLTQSVLSGLFLGLLLLIAAQFYRPLSTSVDFRTLFKRSSLHHPETVRAIGIGILLACVHMAYVNGFYVIGKKWGIWCPLDLDSSQILEGPIPWIEAFMSGYSASWMEELLFRVMGVYLILRLTSQRWIAIIIPAVLWAFLHSNYPQSPGYIRGIELTVVGIINGWIMLRYGIVATLVSHYCYNCWQSLIPVWQVGGWSNGMGSIVVGGWPMVLWLIGLGEWKPENVPQTEKKRDPESSEELWKTPSLFVGTLLTPRLSGFHRRMLLCVGIVLLALSFYSHPLQTPFLERGHIQMTKEEILEKASSLLKEKGFDPRSYRSIITIQPGDKPSEYLSERLSLDLLAQRWFHWNEEILYRVRFYRFEEKEEFQIQFRENGELLQWRHLIPREASGASLESPQALALAEKYLLEEQKIDLRKWNRVTEDLIQQEKRRDWVFEWESPSDKIGEAPLRISLRLQGDEPMLFRSWYKIPEKWIRDHEKTDWRDVLSEQCRHIANILILSLKVFLFIIALRAGLIPWRWTFLLALAPLLLWIIQVSNQIPWFYQGYPTHQPHHFFTLNKIGASVISALATYAGGLLHIGGILGVLRLNFGFRPRHLLLSLRNDHDKTRATRIVWVLFYVGLVQALHSLQNAAWGILHPIDATGIVTPPIQSSIPALESLCLGLNSAYSALFSWAELLAVALWLRRRFTGALPLLVLWLLVEPGLDAKTWNEFLLRSFILRWDEWVLFLFIWRVWKFDWVLIVSAWTIQKWFSYAVLFWNKGGPYHSQSYILIVCILSLMGLVCWTRRRSEIGSYSLAKK